MNSVIPFPNRELNLTQRARARKRSERVSEAEVRQELAKILASAGFVHSSRIKRFLAFVVEETLAGRAGHLCEYSIGVSVFDRDESFEPGLDPIVRNDARRLRNKLLEYYQGLRDDPPSSVLIEVPKGGYVPVFSFAALASETPRAPYRLRVSLIRVADGSELASRTYDLNDSDCCLQFQLEG